MEPDVIPVPATSLLGGIHSCRKIAGGTRQDQTLAGIKEFPAMVRKVEFRLRGFSFFFRKGSPCFETLVHQLESLVRLQGVLPREKFSGGAEDVQPLPGATLDLTIYSEPRILEIVFTFVGDSTITKGFDMSLLITLFLSYVQDLRKKVF